MEFHRSVLQIGKFYPPHVGGMETHLRTLCEGLRSRLDVRVVVSNDNASQAREVVDGIDVTRVGKLCTLASVPICPTLIAALRRAHSQIAHLHLPNPLAALAYLLSGHQGPLVLSWHSDVVRQKGLDTMLTPLWRALLQRASTIVASSVQYVESSPVLSAHRDRCVVIPYGVQLDAFQRLENAALGNRLRHQFGPRIALSVGRLVYYKGMEYLIEAMRGVDGVLLIVGDGPLRANLEGLARAYRVQDKVVFFGQVEDVVPFYHACDVFVLPSVARSEGFGIVQLEAMACGKPVINTSLPTGVPHVSLNGLTGLTVPPRCAESLARAINLMLSNDDLRVRYGRAALDRVRAEFTDELMVGKTVGLYDGLLGQCHNLVDRYQLAS